MNPKISPRHPQYLLKKRYGAYALYRDRQLVGVGATITASGRGMVTLEYTHATRPKEGLVSHSIPAKLFNVQAGVVANRKTAEPRVKAAA